MKDVLQTGTGEVIQIPVSDIPSRKNEPKAPKADSSLKHLLCSGNVRAADLASFCIALGIAIFSPLILSGERLGEVLSLRISVQNLIMGAVLLIIWRAIFWASGLHHPRQNASQFGFIPRGLLAATLAALPVSAAMLLSNHPARYVFDVSTRFWFVGVVLLGMTRVVLFTVYDTVRPMLRKKRNVIVVGTGPRARIMTEQLLQHPSFKYQVCGFVDSDPQPDCNGMGPVLGDLASLDSILMRCPVDEVLIALPLKSSFSDVEDAVVTCGHAGVKALYSVDLFHSNIAKNHSVDEITGVRAMEMVHSDYRLVLKDFFDRSAAFFGILLLSPVFLAIMIAIKLTSKGPAFFVQERWGKNKRTFGMFKFRSMVVDAEARMASLENQNEFGGPMFKLKNDPRVTRIGQFLRRTSLDELPQLLNVLLGDMSLVGPRPLPNRDVALFSEPWLMRRFSVKPGITGLWQVSGRSETDFDQTIRLDLHYIDRWNLPLDLKILFKTVNVVFRGKGAY